MIFEKLKEIFGERIKKNYPLYKLGILSRGKIEYFLEIFNLEELSKFFEIKPQDKNYYVIGAGSNTVADDKLIKGFIIKLGGDFKKIEFKNSTVVVGSGVVLRELVKESMKRGLSGIEFLIGIPGTVGGAMKMNAGCFGKEILDYVKEIEIFKNGKVYKKTAFKYSYRQGPVKDDEILLFTKMRLKKKTKREVKKRIHEYMMRRKKRNLFHPNSKGSVFLNPKNKKAWKLIDEMSLRGFSVGTVRVWERNPNFFVWRRRSKGRDFYKLMRKIMDKVYKEKGIRLKPEINFIGYED
ncbi:MAG: UDP-N-acetylenolpyruvoylglucosamine reductase [Caldiserica bacterium]|nr:MAG: UDP-N-acetylenolpyruvoylglucosamine reductase [Caldisericota bacterium]